MKVTLAMRLLFGLFFVAAVSGAAMAIIGSYVDGGRPLMNWGLLVAGLTVPSLAGYLYLAQRN